VSSRQRENDALRGPPTLSISQTWSGPTTEPASAVFAFENGWGWLARLSDGTRFTQLTIAADAPDLPRRAALSAWTRDRIAVLPSASDWVRDCAPTGAHVVRASTALFRAPWQRRERVLRVGDAAMTVDPLSGNGIYQALSSASVAPAVINTMLRSEETSTLALQFYQERCRHLFERFARIGREFYRAETRWSEHPFWRARSTWPDDELPHDQRSPSIRGIERRPVVDEGFICERDVVVSDDQPLGVWRVAGIEVAPLVRELEKTPAAERRTRIERLGSAALRAWTIRVGLMSG
jgi:hypothetical protein